MVRLRDAKQALADLPPGYLKRVHWLRAKRIPIAGVICGLIQINVLAAARRMAANFAKLPELPRRGDKGS
jgi:hypothetical protein